MKAVVVQPGKTVKTAQKPVPSLKSNEILLKVKAVGLNPTDWKAVVRGIAKPGDISGCDFVGEVVDLGPAVPEDQVTKGEIRWGFMRGGTNPDRGGFAEYVPVEWDISAVVPSNITAYQAASLPIPSVTAVQALYLRLKLAHWSEPLAQGDAKWILIWSGATSVGQFAIQFAKLSGYKVASTASPKRWDQLKKLGADVLVDYNNPIVVAELKKGTNDSIQYGLDCIGTDISIHQAQQAFQPSGGHLVTLIPPNPSVLTRDEVKTEATLAYTALGTDQMWSCGMMPSIPEDRALFVRYARESTALLAEGKLKPLEVEVLGTLEQVQEGFDLLQNGKHSSKIVFRVDGPDE